MNRASSTKTQFFLKSTFSHDIMMIYKEKDIIKQNLNITLADRAESF